MDVNGLQFLGEQDHGQILIGLDIGCTGHRVGRNLLFHALKATPVCEVVA